MGRDEEEQLARDTAYSPSSEDETEAKQANSVPDALDDDIKDDVRVAPGTGGPDDQGDVEVDPDDLNLPTENGSR
ncbi:hypothetical protein [Ruicaihuangia caeni]|uniref:hypothetical protein n=1 Tax=Ruicaihuangia caeni TaxID=3042517 RepID=UPI00338E695E